jgi:zinc protease
MNTFKTYRKITILFFTIFFLILFINVSPGQTVDRSEPPQLGPPPTLNLPPIQKFQLSNGLPVVLMEKHQVPLVQINVMVKAGRVNDPADKTGLASLTMDMLDEGAGKRDALELADAIDYLGARISTSAGYHSSRISLHTPLNKLDSALVLLKDIVLEPTFPESELERLRTERLTTLMQWHDQPNTIASILTSRALYGENHPYGSTSIGSEKNIRSFTVEDLKNFYQTNFLPNNSAIIVVGDVKSLEIVQKLENAFGQWQARKLVPVKLPKVEQVKTRKILLVDKPGAAQSVISIGRIGLPRETKDYYAALVMNTILGGSFTSRLNQNLRETHGYTYGAGSYFMFLTDPGPFIARSSVQTEVTDKALQEFMKELNDIRSPVTEEELTRAKNYIALRYPRNFETVDEIADQLEDLIMYQLPDDYFNRYIGNILAVSGKQVQQAADKYIVPGQVDIIIVGDREKIEPGLRNMNLGPIDFYTVEDVLGQVPDLTN